MHLIYINTDGQPINNPTPAQIEVCRLKGRFIVDTTKTIAEDLLKNIMSIIKINFYDEKAGYIENPSFSDKQAALAAGTFSIEAPVRELTIAERTDLSDKLDELVQLAKTVIEPETEDCLSDCSKYYAVFDYVEGFRLKGSGKEIQKWLGVNGFKPMACTPLWYENTLTKVWVGAGN